MNGILEEFKIVFGLDNQALNTGVDNSQKKLVSFGKIVGSLGASFLAFKGFQAITSDFVQMSLKIGDATSVLGVNAKEFSSLGNALERFGGNSDSVSSSIQSLNGHLEAAKHGQGALLEVSKKYGLQVDPYAKPMDTLKSLTKQLGNYSSQQQLQIASQLGLDNSILRAAKDGGKSLEEQIALQEKLGSTTQKDIDISNDFNNSQLQLRDVFSALTRDFARVILPSFTALVDTFSTFINWIREHKQLVIIFFAGMAIAMLPVLITLGQMAIATVIAFAPLIAVVAVVSVIALVLEDVYAYFMGWDSVTGDLVGKFPLLGAFLEPIRPLVMGIADTFGAIVDFLSDPSWDSFINIFQIAGNALYDLIVKPFEDLFSMFSDWVSSFSDVGETIKGWFGFGDDDEKDKDKKNKKETEREAVQAPIVQAPSVPMQSSSMNQANNYNVNNNFNQNISSATPKQFADTTNSQIVGSITDIRQQNGAIR